MNILIAEPAQSVEAVVVVDPILTPTNEVVAPVKFDGWHDYLAALDPNDQSAVFVLPDESLALTPCRLEILSAVELVIARAFGRKATVIEFLYGTLQGNARLLLPQGVEIAYSADNAPAWRVEVDLHGDAFCQRATLYFKAPTFNPVRVLSDQDGVIGAMFTLADADETLWIKGSAETDSATEISVQRLRTQFEELQK